MARRSVVLTLLVLCAACTSSTSSTTTTTSDAITSTSSATTTETGSTLADMIGRWDLVEYTVNDVTSSVEVGANAAEGPWVLVTEVDFYGSLGCNSFNGNGVGYELSATHLIPGEVVVHDVACATEGAMEVEEVFRDFVWAAELKVVFDGDEMTWTLGGDDLVFSR